MRLVFACLDKESRLISTLPWNKSPINTRLDRQDSDCQCKYIEAGTTSVRHQGGSRNHSGCSAIVET